MNDPQAQPSSEPLTGSPIRPGSGGAPFSPGRAEAPTGCGRYALAGCGALTLLLGIAAVVFLFKADDLLSWTLRKMESQIAAELPAELGEAERARFHEAFAGARGAIERGEIDPAALQRLQGKLAAVAGRRGESPPGREEILDLVTALEAVAHPSRPAPPAGDGAVAD